MLRCGYGTRFWGVDSAYGRNWPLAQAQYPLAVLAEQRITQFTQDPPPFGRAAGAQQLSLRVRKNAFHELILTDQLTSGGSLSKVLEQPGRDRQKAHQRNQPIGGLPLEKELRECEPSGQQQTGGERSAIQHFRNAVPYEQRWPALSEVIQLIPDPVAYRNLETRFGRHLVGRIVPFDPQHATCSGSSQVRVPGVSETGRGRSD